MDFRLQSPYCNNYKVPNQHKGLIMQHLIVRKLTRRELEDKYLRIIDENYDLKRENNVQKEKIKVLTTKLLRITNENNKNKSREFLFMNENNEIQEAEEFFRHRRPMSSSAISRDLRDMTRNSTPNLDSRYKSDFFLVENSNIEMKSQQGHADSTKNKGSHEVTSQLEEQIGKLNEELRKLQEISELEKETNAQLEVQVRELREKLNCEIVQKELQVNIHIEELTKTIQEMKKHLETVDKCYQLKLDDCKKQQENLSELLEKERQKAVKCEITFTEFEASRKTVEKLMERIAAMEKEKAEICSHLDFQTYASATQETADYKKKMSKMREMLEVKEKALEKERSDRESIEHSQDELLTKMKNLQKENDELVVRLEGLKTENEGLLCKNKKLESRIKDLETLNKQQLHKINETLKMPTRPTSERGSISLMKTAAVGIPRSVNSSIRMSTPPSLSIPNVNVTGEKRPDLFEKELKVIPKIIEPLHLSASVSFDQDSMSRSHHIGRASASTSLDQELASKRQLTSVIGHTSNSVSFDLESTSKQQLTSIIGSKDSTILEDLMIRSDTNKAFADAFSRSVSKDVASIDDDFDPKTFSIDQVSDADGVSELMEDDEDYEYLFDAGKF